MPSAVAGEAAPIDIEGHDLPIFVTRPEVVNEISRPDANH